MATREGYYADQRTHKAKTNELRSWLYASVLQHGTLAIHSTAEQFKTTTVFVWRRNGIQFTKAATDALTFTAAHVVTASKYGIVLVQINDAGTISTKCPGATQTTAMAYDTAAEALAALPSVDAGNVAMGHIAILNNAGTWTANTDDLTNGSDLATATFVNATVTAFPAAL